MESGQGAGMGDVDQCPSWCAREHSSDPDEIESEHGRLLGVISAILGSTDDPDRARREHATDRVVRLSRRPSDRFTWVVIEDAESVSRSIVVSAETAEILGRILLGVRAGGL